jgi:Trm5-related predicted tRNA methylase
MKKANRKSATTEMRAEYDFSKGIRSKYAHRYSQGSNVVVLEPDVAKVFTDSKAVNRSLRALAGIVKPRRKRGSSRISAPAMAREKATKKYGK